MRSGIRTGLASLALGIAAVAGLNGLAHSTAIAFTPHVQMIDNDAPFRPPGNPGIGLWGFGPTHIEVTQGDKIVFDNPAGNHQGHSVTSMTWSGMAPYTTLESGTAFNSSPTRDQLIRPGDSWTLDTTPLNPGQYLYYCNIHPWMTGTFTVSAAT